MIHKLKLHVPSENSYTVSMVGAMDMYEGNAGPFINFMFIHVTIKPSKFSLCCLRLLEFAVCPSIPG